MRGGVDWWRGPRRLLLRRPRGRLARALLSGDESPRGLLYICFSRSSFYVGAARTTHILCALQSHIVTPRVKNDAVALAAGYLYGSRRGGSCGAARHPHILAGEVYTRRYPGVEVAIELHNLQLIRIDGSITKDILKRIQRCDMHNVVCC